METKNTTLFGGLTTKLHIEDASFLVLEGPHEGSVVPLVEEVVRIGRADWCEVSLSDDHWVSQLHCECVWDERGLRVKDLGSRNGISVNGVPVLEAYLVDGARLQVGHSVLHLKHHQATRELSISYRDQTGLLVGRSREMRKLFSFLPRLRQRAVTTLLLGETGTGKTSIAKAIHGQSEEDTTPFVVVNCGALPASLIEGVLFGYEKGAFTGASRRHAGFFEQAHGGVLFLDEIAELPLSLQPKLLDVIERKRVRRLGSTEEHEVDFHLICATHRDLRSEVEAGRFREDLYFRISVVELEVPPLRDRKEDLPLLIESLLASLEPERSIFISEAAVRALQGYLWPGNIRELRNLLERTLTFLDGTTIDVEDLQIPNVSFGHTQKQATSPSEPARPSSSVSATAPEAGKWAPALPLLAQEPPVSLKDILAHTEGLLLLQALEECEGNVLDASRLLGISDSWFYNRLKKYGLSPKK